MKRFITLFVVSLCLLTACATVHVNPLPAGAKACSSDWDCPDGQGCWFSSTPGWNYAQCLQGHDNRWTKGF